MSNMNTKEIREHSTALVDFLMLDKGLNSEDSLAVIGLSATMLLALYEKDVTERFIDTLKYCSELIYNA